ncbi:hypothetical protein CHS0354_040646 [Potamilus streckersoni]|uniref:Uncharacterized protein n=1 Tax=Potamilus streckersoni TaxID=2493646 RepID=A0AAE0TCJ5_9BIVA|nr:hypothetical protein CHS0354_040646 [Potamilus streckersoni]
MPARNWTGFRMGDTDLGAGSCLDLYSQFDNPPAVKDSAGRREVGSIETGVGAVQGSSRTEEEKIEGASGIVWYGLLGLAMVERKAMRVVDLIIEDKRAGGGCGESGRD